MKILIFSWRDIRHPEAGGAELYVHELAKRWVDQGYPVTLFTARPRGQSFRDNIEGLEVFRAGGRFTVYIWAILAYFLVLRTRADVILDVGAGIPFYTPLYSKKPMVCLFFHVHQDQFLVELGPVLGRFGKLMERHLIIPLYRRARFVAISDSTVEDMRSAFNLPDDFRIEVIRPGIDHGQYSVGSEKFEKPAVLYLGRIKAYKRLSRLIAMMPAVRREVPDAELIVAGKGDGLPEAQEEVERIAANDYVRFLGHVSEKEKIRLLQGAWVLASPSMNEGWGLTVVEANACGTPAVAFRVSGLEESIADGESGMLAESDGEFTRDLITILSDEAERNRLGRGAVEWAASFDWEEAAQKMLDIMRVKAIEG